MVFLVSFIPVSDKEETLEQLELLNWNESNVLGMVEFEPAGSDPSWPLDDSLPAAIHLVMRFSYSLR